MQASQSTGANALCRAQAFLVIYRMLLTAGTLENVLTVQSHRNTLITICRQYMAGQGSLFRRRPEPPERTDEWSQWVFREANCRLIYSTWGQYHYLYVHRKC